MSIAQKTVARLETQAAVYENQAQKFAQGDKPYEKGLCNMLNKAAQTLYGYSQAMKTDNPLKNALAYYDDWAAFKPEKEADQALKLFDELQDIETYLADPPDENPPWWPYPEFEPPIEEQIAIAASAKNYVQAAIEELGLKGFADAQKLFLGKKADFAYGERGGCYIPPVYLTERAAAKAICNNVKAKQKSDAYDKEVYRRVMKGGLGLIGVSLAALYATAYLASSSPEQKSTLPASPSASPTLTCP